MATQTASSPAMASAKPPPPPVRKPAGGNPANMKQAPRKAVSASPKTPPPKTPEEANYHNIKKIILLESWIILGLAALALFIGLFLSPGYKTLAVKQLDYPLPSSFNADAASAETAITQSLETAPVISADSAIPLVAMSLPNLSDAAVSKWAATAATSTMTMNFNNYEQRLQNARKWFMADAWQNYEEVFRNSKYFDLVANQGYILGAVAYAPPIIVESGMIDGKRRWIVQVPMLYSLLYRGKVTPHRQVTELTIGERAGTKENPFGLGILKWEDRDAGKGL